MSSRFLFLQVGPHPDSGPTGYGVVFECETREAAVACMLEKLHGEGASHAKETVPGVIVEGVTKRESVWYISCIPPMWEKTITQSGPGSYFLAPPCRLDIDPFASAARAAKKPCEPLYEAGNILGPWLSKEPLK